MDGKSDRIFENESSGGGRGECGLLRSGRP